MPGEDLGVAERAAGVKGVGDGGVPQDPGGRRDAEDHAIDVTAVDRLAGCRPEDEWSFGSLAAAGIEDPEHRHREGHGCLFAALADQVQHPVPAQGLGVVLDPHRGGLRCAQGVDASRNASAP